MNTQKQELKYFEPDRSETSFKKYMEFRYPI